MIRTQYVGRPFKVSCTLRKFLQGVITSKRHVAAIMFCEHGHKIDAPPLRLKQLSRGRYWGEYTPTEPRSILFCFVVFFDENLMIPDHSIVIPPTIVDFIEKPVVEKKPEGRYRHIPKDIVELRKGECIHFRLYVEQETFDGEPYYVVGERRGPKGVARLFNTAMVLWFDEMASSNRKVMKEVREKAEAAGMELNEYISQMEENDEPAAK